MDFNDLYLQSSDSTNRVAREMGYTGTAHGSGVLADYQESGRGRLGRKWFSPPGRNLYCSYIVRPAIAVDQYPKLTMVAGVAAAQCLQNLAGIDMGLKWPNDLYIHTRKCGGILSEFSTDQDEQPFAVIGIGINCNMAASEVPAELRKIATSLVIEGVAEIDIKGLFHALRVCLLTTINEFENNGFKTILDSWCRFDVFRGTNMTWVRPGGTAIAGENLGPDEDGALMVKDIDGKIHHIVSGEVTSSARDNR